MKEIDNLRKRINTIDETIMSLLDQRFDIVKNIGTLKRSQKAAIEDNSRESIILDKAKTYSHESEIKIIYGTIFTVSKNLQRK
ncbi:MAG: chorismate mutase [Bacillota bacterium]